MISQGDVLLAPTLNAFDETTRWGARLARTRLVAGNDCVDWEGEGGRATWRLPDQATSTLPTLASVEFATFTDYVRGVGGSSHRGESLVLLASDGSVLATLMTASTSGAGPTPEDLRRVWPSRFPALEAAGVQVVHREYQDRVAMEASHGISRKSMNAMLLSRRAGIIQVTVGIALLALGVVVMVMTRSR